MTARIGGFTLVEVLVAIVILSMGILALLGSTRVSIASARSATLELRVAHLIQEEVERLRALPVDSLRDGSATRPDGSARWIVTDSTSYVRVELVVDALPASGATLGDTLYLYRPR